MLTLTFTLQRLAGLIDLTLTLSFYSAYAHANFLRNTLAWPGQK